MSDNKKPNFQTMDTPLIKPSDVKALKEKESKVEREKEELANTIFNAIMETSISRDSKTTIGEFIMTGDPDIDKRIRQAFIRDFYDMLSGGLTTVRIYLITKDGLVEYYLSPDSMSNRPWEHEIIEHLRSGRVYKIVVTRVEKLDDLHTKLVTLVIGKNFTLAVGIPFKNYIIPAEGDFLTGSKEFINNVDVAIDRTSNVRKLGLKENIANYFHYLRDKS